MTSSPSHARFRRLVDAGATVACAVSVALLLGPLVWLVVVAFTRAAPVLSLRLWFSGAAAGGLGHALSGSLALVGLASLLGGPVGVLAGIAGAQNRRLGWWVRASADILSAVPPVIVGLVVYLTVVLTTTRFSLLAGAIALSVVLAPPIARTTIELVSLVPRELSDAALGLGATRWRATLWVSVRAVLPGISAALLVGVARIAGEAVPLLLTAFTSQRAPRGLLEPSPSLAVEIFTLAQDGTDARAWAAVLTLMTLVTLLHLLGRSIARRGR